MKLFTRYNRIYLLATVFIFLMAILVFYFFLRFVLIRQVDEDLEIERSEIIAYAARYQRLPEIIEVNDQNISYAATAQPVPANLYKTIAKNTDEEDLRQLQFSIGIQGKFYNITIKKSLEGTDHLTRSVATIALVTILLIFVASYVVNRMVLRRLWQPFYHTLTAMQQFRLGRNQQLQLPESNTAEFIFMNHTLQQATQKAEQDYVLLKEFTENASHELQTPLAIIRSKLELLMQYNMSEAQSQALQSANDAVQSLARFNQSLLLLTKIQNNQFAHKTIIDLKATIENKLAAFKEIGEAKNITLQFSLADKQLLMNTDLAALLINNLLSNAIKHNMPGGRIDVALTDKSFTISNTGTGKALDESRIFTRFYNPANAENSTGLGLSIVRQICNASDFTVQYHYENKRHQFSIIF